MLTRDFSDTVKARAAADETFRGAMQDEANCLLLSGDVRTAQALLLHLEEACGVHLAVRPQAG